MSMTKMVLMKIHEQGPASLDPVERKFARFVHIKATLVKGYELQPGDLFSTAGPDYWDKYFDHRNSVGEKVYIRTNFSPNDFEDANQNVYKIEIIHEATGHGKTIYEKESEEVQSKVSTD